MIKSNIQTSFVHQYGVIQSFNESAYVADYTEQTKTLPIKKSVEFFSPNPPTDIDFFSIINTPKLDIDGIGFDNNSFVYSNGNAKSQCEAVFFPSTSNPKSWILLCELKYSSKPLNNTNNLRKAIKQLFKTRFYYIQENVISASNTCYLLASLPMQSEPFANFSVTPAFLIKLKSSRNIILRLKNTIEVEDNLVLKV